MIVMWVHITGGFYVCIVFTPKIHYMSKLRRFTAASIQQLARQQNIKPVGPAALRMPQTGWHTRICMRPRISPLRL